MFIVAVRGNSQPSALGVCASKHWWSCKFLNVWMVIVLFLKKWQLALLFPWIPLSDEHLNNLVSWNVKIQNSRGKINPYVLKLDLFEFFRHKNCSCKDWVETVHLLLSSTAPYALITKLNYPFRFIGCFDCHLKEALLRDVTKQNKLQIPSYITAWFLACRLIFEIGESCLLLLFFLYFHGCHLWFYLLRKTGQE